MIILIWYVFTFIFTFEVYSCEVSESLIELFYFEMCKVWKPIVHGTGGASSGPSLIILDEFRAHMTASTIDAFEKLGTVVDFIPGGYTSVLQPLDVGINKPFKDRFRSLYNAYCVEHFDGDLVPKTDRFAVASMVVNAWNEIPPQMIKNAWKKCKYAVDGENSQENLSPTEAVQEELIEDDPFPPIPDELMFDEIIEDSFPCFPLQM
jgi:hypothetical protein